MPYRESDVRDSLASHLDFIEVKRSDQTSREAVQEVLKYAELLRREHGHAEHRLRLVIASTSWRELETPFSALVRFCPYPLLGVRIEVEEESGQVVGSSPIEGLPPSIRGQISDAQILLLWTEGDRRDKAWDKIAPQLHAVGLKDFLGAEINFVGEDKRIIYPFGLALVPGRISPEDAQASELTRTNEVAQGIGPEEVAEGLHAKDGVSVETKAMTRLMESAENIWDDAEGLSPDAWVRLEQRGWILSRLHRVGSFAAATYVEDEELAVRIGGREGMNRTLMEVDVSPDLGLAWDEAVLRSRLVLEGNQIWQEGLTAWLNERETEEARDYHLRIYSLGEIIKALLSLALFRDGRWVDTLRVTAGAQNDPECSLGGLVIWGGGGCSPIEAVERILPGGLDSVGFELAMGGPEVDSELMKAMDLSYALYQRFKSDEVPWRYERGKQGGPAIDSEVMSIFEFVSTHADSLGELREAIEESSFGYFG